MVDYDPSDDAIKSYYAAIEAKRAFLELVRATFDYDASAGSLTWRTRPRDQFVSKRGHSIWNARYAGRVAGNRRWDGYITVRLNGRRYLAHRLIWLMVWCRWPSEMLDHINGNPSDNRLANLREVTVSENARNMKRGISNSSGVVGVRWLSRDKRWRAEITANGHRHNLGEFTAFEAAVAKRKNAERELGFHPNHGRAA